MKKIKLLRGLIIALGIFQLTRFITIVIHMPLEQIKYIIPNIPLLLLIGLIYLERGLSYNIKFGYFNTQSALLLKRGGLFLILSGFFNLTTNLFSLYIKFNTPEIKALLLQNVSKSFLISIIGFGIIIISDFINSGNLIKNENDLTV